MRIIETVINDIPNKNLNESKLNLVDEVINFIQPIFNKECKDKIKEIKDLKKSIIEKKDKMNNQKIKLEQILKDYSKKDKEKQLLNKMGKLIQTGLIQESMKHEMVVLLKSFDNIEEDKIVSYLNETMNILSNRFSKT